MRGANQLKINFRHAVWLAGVVCVLASGAGTAYGQWPQFRGPNGSGVDSAAGYPVTFSPSKNVVWKTAVPFGQSSPVLAGGQLYLTASDKGRLVTIALDAATGRELWRREIQPARTHKIYKANDPASPTPAADDDGVVVFFPDFGLAAYTHDGKERWTVPLGPFKSFYGMAASPIVSGDVVVLVCDQQTGSYVLAVDRKTGRCAGRRTALGAVDAYSTPMVFRPAAGAGTTDRARFDASGLLRPRHRRPALVDADRLERCDGHRRRERRYALRRDFRDQRAMAATVRDRPAEARR